MPTLQQAFPVRTAHISEFPELQCLFDRIQRTYRPLAVYLFGSRARGEATAFSDWDLKVVVPDDAPEAWLSPRHGFAVQQGAGVFADITCARVSDFIDDRAIANTIAVEILRDGVQLEAA